MARSPTQLSRQLSQVLDGYGVSRSLIEFRRKTVDCLAFDLVNVDDAESVLFFVTGSKRDALCSVNDAESDFDVLAIMPLQFVLAKCFTYSKSNSDQQDFFCLEKGQKPGYYFIKVLHDCDDFECFTRFKECIYLNNTFKEMFLGSAMAEETDIVHGPALNATFQGDDDLHQTCDRVFATHFSSLPEDYDEWCNRRREHSWPPQWIIETTKTLGCLAVGVGHPTSDTQIIEWRLSLNRTEYLLTKSFTNIQMKCYVLLRLVLKWLIQPKLKDPLSSYHVKTVMFWMIEEQDKQFWRPENLTNCLMCSLSKLKTFVDNKNCPNYFLTDVNLLEGKLEGDIQHNVLELLNSIIAEGPTVVYQCLPLNAHMNGAGCRHLNQASCSCLHKHLIEDRLTEMALSEEYVHITCTKPCNASMYRSYQFSLTDWHVVNECYNGSLSDSHTFSCISVCEEMGMPNKCLYFLQKEHIAKLRGNGYVARIKLATLFFHRRRFSYCLPLLSLVITSMESSREFEVCTEEAASARYIVEIEGVECIYLTQNNKGFRVSEIVFDPCDQLLIPFDLQDAMRRPKTVNGTHYEGWVFVDSIVYAYYLLIVTLHAMRRYSGITSLFTRFRKVCNQQPGAIRIFRKDMADRLYEHAYILLWSATKGFTQLS